MSFSSKKEKFAYVQGLRAGARGKKPFAKAAPRPAGKAYPLRREKSGGGYYRNAGQDDKYWNDFFQASLRRGDSDKPTGKSTSGTPAKQSEKKLFSQLSKSEQIRATERAKKAEYKRYQDDLYDVDRSLFLGVDKRGK